MNAQRNVVYAKRRHALMGERIGVDITNMIYDTAETIVGEMRDVLDYEGLNSELLKVFAMEAPFDEDTFKSAKEQSLVEQVMEAAINAFKRKMDKMATVAQPIIKQVYETKGEQYQNIVMPVTDGKRVFSITTNLKDAYESQCKELVKSFEKFALLYVIDDEWKEHLRQLDELRQSVQNASYEQKDPLLIYKLESFNLFKNMIDSVNRKVIAILMRGQIPMREPEQVRQAQETKRMDMSRYRTQKDSGVPGNDPTKQDTREIQRPEPFRAEKKVGRNDPCPCGSGLKYKNCHGK